MSGAFDRLARPVQKWIRAQGWTALRDLQVQAIGEILGGEADLILSASTAGGKTEAAFLPLISSVLDRPLDGSGFDLLYIGPLKALITDQANRLEEMCREADLPVTPWHGDVSTTVKARALKKPEGILLITPESLEALFVRRGLEIPRLFGRTRAVVIDELHSVLDSERGVQMRSLLTRLELAVGHPIRRIGLSATLGDMDLAKGYLRPDAAERVHLIQVEGGSAELKLQLRGYVTGLSGAEEGSATSEIAKHLFKALRGSDNLIFAGRRQDVEIYADRLRELCESQALPVEFHAHHANLSRDHRAFVEQCLKDPNKPTTAVCTSTLELGIDIGDVACVAQIGAPFTVAALRQRLGRSGRREGRPAILRQYAVEARLEAKSNVVDRLRLGLIRAIAMIDLLLEGWCEPPKGGALHLSTLIHQILSVIAEKGGASANRLYRTLCQAGPFRQVDVSLFTTVLRAMGDPDTALIEQTDNGLLLLGRVGEQLVEHYSFYAVFQTPEEYRLVTQGRELGTLSVDNIVAPGMMVIFSGRRWVIQQVHEQDRVITVTKARSGIPPTFGGDPGEIHDRVIERMFELLEGDARPVYLDKVAASLLEEARRQYTLLGLGEAPIIQQDDGTFVLLTRCGTVKTLTLALALRSQGFTVEPHDGLLEVSATEEEHIGSLRTRLAEMKAFSPVTLFPDTANLVFEKYHRYLTPDLRKVDALSCRLDLASLPQITACLLEHCAKSGNRFSHKQCDRTKA